MEILTELVKLPEKELRRILVDKPCNPYLLVDKQYSEIAKILSQVKKTIIYQKEVVGRLGSSTDSADYNSLSPRLLYKDLKDIIQRNIFRKVYNYGIKTNAKILDSIVKSSLLPEEEYDIQVNEERIHLIIHYPELVVTNSVEMKHTIKDVYIEFVFSNYLGLLSIYFNRSTFSDLEVKSNYKFSHVSSNSFNWSSSICYGTGPIRDLIDKCTIDLRYLRQLFFYYREYLKWESLEGAPYHKIESIYSKLPEVIFEFSSMENDLLQKLYENIDQLHYSFKLSNGNYILSLNTESIDNIDRILTTNFPQYNYYFVDNKSVKFEPIYIENGLQGIELFEFKGKQVTLNITHTSEDDVNKILQYEKRTHRQLLKFVVDQIESDLMHFIINSRL
jgi:hypothetical protein